MTRRLLAALAICIAVEVGVFHWRHHDVVHLSLPREVVLADPAFAAEAAAVLARDHVSRRVLERIADIAQERGERDLQIQALERIAEGSRDGVRDRLRLAQALHDAGRLEQAESLYRAELGLGVGGGR
jgi:signal transduction histidine kinase